MVRPTNPVPEHLAETISTRYLDGKTITEIGNDLHINYSRVRKTLLANGIKIRTKGYESGSFRGNPKPLNASFDEVVAHYNSGKSCNQIAHLYGTYADKVARLLRRNGVVPEDGRSRRGSAHPNAKGRQRASKEGYVTVLLDPHEYDLNPGRNGVGKRTMLEHRLVMARHLGRALYPYENVHHINGIKFDNRLENLELWNMDQPPGQRAHEAPPRKHCPTCTCCD